MTKRSFWSFVIGLIATACGDDAASVSDAGSSTPDIVVPRRDMGPPTPECRDLDCEDDDPCTTNERCDASSRTCTFEMLDGDDDGHPPPACGGDDCDDDDPSIFPGNAELCDGRDEDCDGDIDDGSSADLCGDGRCVDGTCSTPPDAGPRDSGVRDSGPRDSGPPDSGPRDSGPRDSGPRDSGPRDAGPPACTTGTACDDGADCRGGDAPALPTRGGTICAAEDSERVTAGGMSWTQVSWADGYCIDRIGALGTPGGCDPDTHAGCASCAECVPLFDDSVLGTIYGCLEACDLTGTSWMTGNGGCRDGYTCSLLDGVCLPGCSTDEECRARWVDANEDGVRNAGETTYDATSTAVCNRATFRCDGLPSTPTGFAGTPCTDDGDCEPGGDCLPADGVTSDWDNGYCTKRACALSGNACGGTDALCLLEIAGAENGLCLNGCTVGNEADRFLPDDECPAGDYACLGDGTSATGGCLPGNYNAIRVPNYGAACTSDAECYSPFGGGNCLTVNGRSTCTWLDCDNEGYGIDMSGPGMTPDSTVCEADSLCVHLGPIAACFEQCDPAPPAGMSPGCTSPGMICYPTLDGGEHDGFCYPACRNDADCAAGVRCAAGRCA